MKCPRDGSELRQVRVNGIELDKCHQCDGIWFDPGELDRIRELDRSDVEEQIEQQYGNPNIAQGQVDGYMRCPRCADGRLNQITYTFERRVKIDRCDQCFGVWLDDKELDAIIGEKKQLEELADNSALKAFMRVTANLFRA
jgi:uncharacterized protein